MLNDKRVADAALLVARIMLAAIFVMGGFGKMMNYAGAAAYMDKSGIPSILLPLVILTELGGGLLILTGFQTRLAAFLLAGFTLLSGLLVHFHLSDSGQMIHFWKNVAITGGFCVLFAAGPGLWSLDGWRSRLAFARLPRSGQQPT